MNRWPEEYEALRQEAREVSAAVVEAMPTGREPGESVGDMARRMREGIDLLLPRSPNGNDEEVAGVPVRTFRVDQPRGTYLQIHGGAMLFGAPHMDDDTNEAISQGLGVDVVSVDYRLAPEDPFPAGADDCFAVAAALLEAGERRMVIGGESAGGTHSATTVLRLRDAGLLDGVLGVNFEYGLYDLSATPSLRGVRPSDLADAIDTEGHVDVLDAYLPGRSPEEQRDPACSPLYADLTGLPPAHFTVGLADHLLDDTLFMAARWQAWGNEAELAVYPDAIHGFLRWPTTLAERGRARVTDFLARCFDGAP
jgi:acetyl esterase/lipase